MIDQFRELEDSLLQIEVRKSSNKTDDLLAADFEEFGQSGRVWSRKTTIDALAKEEPLDRKMLDFNARHLSADVVLVTYRSVSVEMSNAREKHALRSSIWVRREGRWQMTFHQGTSVAAPV